MIDRTLLSCLAVLGLCAALAAQCCTLPPPDMIAWWPLDETSGTTAFERLNRFNGTYTAFAFPPGVPMLPVRACSRSRQRATCQPPR